MKRKSKSGDQIRLFDNYPRALVSSTGSGTPKSVDKVADFLSQLREQHNSTQDLLTKILDNGNLNKAVARIEQNKGGSGVDRKEIEETLLWLGANSKELVRSIELGDFKVEAVKLVEIEKPEGGKRLIGIPRY